MPSIVHPLRVLMLAAVLLLAAACGAPAGSSTGAATTADPATATDAASAAGTEAVPAAAGKKVNVVTPYMANATTKFAIERFQEYGTSKGWEVSAVDTNSDFNALVSRIQDAVTQNVDAIVLGMGDPAQMTQGLEAAKAANIPVFGLDAGNAEGVLLNITSDNAALGKTSADALAKAIGEQGNVVMFTHDPHPGVRARAQAAEEALKAYPNITIMDKQHVEVPGPVDNARTVMQNLLTANPDTGQIAGVWAGWDEPALGAVQALDAAGRAGETAVVGVDGTDFAKAEIAKKGAFKATVAQDFDAMAKQLADLVEETLDGEQPDKDLYLVPGTLISQDQ